MNKEETLYKSNLTDNDLIQLAGNEIFINKLVKGKSVNTIFEEGLF